MPTVTHRATLQELSLEKQHDLLRAVVTVLIGELNTIRTRLVPPLDPLTGAEVLAKIKGAL